MRLPSLAEQVIDANLAMRHLADEERMRKERDALMRRHTGHNATGPTLKDRLLQLLSARRDLSLPEIKQEFEGFTNGRLHEALTQLIAAGRVERFGARRLYRYRIA